MKETATFAGGCFWCTEAVFTELKGVISVTPGYSGGDVEKPSYEDVCSGTTGHAEAIQIEFDPEQIKFADLADVFFKTHDPTTLNRQGDDSGTQYRSAIFYRDTAQKTAAEDVKKQIEAEKIFPDPIVTEITPFKNFYEAEDYHKNYFARNPDNGYCQLIINPKLQKFRKEFSARLKR
jgi:peptide-methionine (S)-S-oxide reductase